VERRDYWSRFERFVSLLTRTWDDVYIVTGPLYLPSQTPLGYFMQHPMLGASSAARPSHYLPVTLLSSVLCYCSLGGVCAVLMSRSTLQILSEEALLRIVW
jgi:nuclease EXOG